MNRAIPTIFAALAACVCLLSTPAAPADVLSSVFNLDAGLTSLELVSVGNAGEGNVDYYYMIGKYEVTNAQYAVFLNAVARDGTNQSDTYGLHHSSMDITFDGTEGKYLVTSGWENRPVNYVTWSDAARFVNWLHHGQLTEAEMSGITEDGAYTMNGASGPALDVDRNPGARYWIPSGNEWRKAGYYDPTRPADDPDFWTYPFAPNGDSIDGSRANYYESGIGTTSDVGSYTSSSSYYGTFDQGGNVAEWMEEKSYSNPTSRGLRGGSYLSNGTELYGAPTSFTYSNEGSCMGFRIAGVPEPGGVAALIGMAAVGFVWFWRRR